MYFDSYKNFPDAIIDQALLWGYDVEKFDFQQMRDDVVQRVIIIYKQRYNTAMSYNSECLRHY